MVVVVALLVLALVLSLFLFVFATVQARGFNLVFVWLFFDEIIYLVLRGDVVL